MENVIFGDNYKIKPLRVMGGQKIDECYFCFEVVKKGLFGWKRVEDPLTLNCWIEGDKYFLGTYDVGYIKRTGSLPSESLPIENFPLIISVLIEFSYFSAEVDTNEAHTLRQLAKNLYETHQPQNIAGRYIP